MNADTGGPAFRSGTNDGMTLRDYFAAKVPSCVLDIEGWTTADCSRFLGLAANEYEWRKHYRILLARLAYEWADAMLAERAK